MTTPDDIKTKLKNITKKWFYLKEEVDSKIPSASSTTPSADTTTGGNGVSSDFARADHKHPQSSLYATSVHNHDSISGGVLGVSLVEDFDGMYAYAFNRTLTYDVDDTGKIYYDKNGDENYLVSEEIATIGDINGKADSNDFDTLTATVNYTDNTSETVTFYIVPNNSS